MQKRRFLKKIAIATINGINATTENTIPHKVVSKASDMSPSNSEGSAAPGVWSVLNAFTMPITVPTKPNIGGMTTPTPKMRVTRPQNFVDCSKFDVSFINWEGLYLFVELVT